MLNENKKLLNRGCVVKIKNSDLKYMIIDNLVMNDNVNFEYSAVVYPTGIINYDNLIYFNSSDIDILYFFGNNNDL